MAAQKFLEELSIQQLLNKYNFIIPEIQREYVWGNNDFNILDKFFNDIKDASKESISSNEDLLQIQSLEKMLERAEEKDKESIRKLIDTYLSKKDMNIGFLYSYRPDYYIYNDRNDDVYLIDGQQRITTLFLSLIYFALKENYYDDFLSFLRFDNRIEKVAFDYRVRSLTHSFIIELLSRCSSVEDLLNIKEKKWFLSDFSSDVTVKALIGTINKLDEYFGSDNNKYYHFVKKQIRFWHFKTEETSQGEELYITMNSRGQQLADNETVRAKLFENDIIKENQIEWGAKWEKWQDFFWKNKLKDGNADNGLNQFLRWVNIIECFSTQTFKTRELAEKEYKRLINENYVLDYVSLNEIEPYFNALEQLKALYDSDYFKLEFFTNNFSQDWLKGELSQIHLIKLLPSMMFLKANRPEGLLNRFTRFFSNITNDSDIAKNPDTYIVESIQLTKQFIDDGFTDVVDLISFKEKYPRILSSEEICKLSLYKNTSDDVKRRELEETFWLAEDFKYCKGKIGHLIQMASHTNDYLSFKYSRSFDYNTIRTIDLNNFKEVYFAYSELIKNEDAMWGHLLNTPVYFEESDRVTLQGIWYLENGFLKFVLDRKENNKLNLNDFLINNEKSVIKNYTNTHELKEEANPRKQLFIYYILHKRILEKWSWSKWNFGIYEGDDYPEYTSLFNEKYIYQQYKWQWRYNVGYVENDGIWIQNNFDDSRDYFEELINWANS
ncbi:MAG TPA: DUF262 domain-containing protein [Gallicola sp.]|nr:DUF262 domain-containing protein [Gallicola sp.]